MDPVDFYYDDESSERDTVGVEDSISVAGNVPNSTPNTCNGRNDQIQVDVLINYEGNLRLTISTELLINQPTPAFLILPIRMRITKLHINGMF
jgi:distribution and morphology protein 12